MRLSVVLATYNEEVNIGSCLESVKELADEIVIVDGSSTDHTAQIAHSYGARVLVTSNPAMFHINKQKALEAARGTWILQLDADERVSGELATEIKKIIAMSDEEIIGYEKNLPSRALFDRHQAIINKREGTPKQEGMYAAFYIPRLNYFLGTYLRHGGVYPDGAIRLVKKGKAHFPCRDIHEVMEVEGRTGWLQNPLYHYDSPTFARYIERNNRYINHLVTELQEKKVGKNFREFLHYSVMLPVSWFFMTQIRHKGILDGWQGIVFSFFSALRFPRAYWRYLAS